MKILFLSSSFYPSTYIGGPIFSSLNLLNLFALKGNDVVVHTFRGDPSKVSPDDQDTLQIPRGYTPKYFELNVFGFKSFYFETVRQLQSADVVIVNGIFCKFILPMSFIIRILRKKMVILPRGSLQKSNLDFKKNLYAAVLKAFMPKMTTIIWTSKLEKQESSLNSHRSRIIPNIVVTPPPVQPTPFQGRSKYFLYVGRLHPHKQLELVIDAFRIFNNYHFSQYKLIIAGTGDDYYVVKLREKVDKLGMSAYVDFVGELFGPAKFQLYKEATASFLISKSENFGNSALESLCMHTPVIVSKNTLWADFHKTGCVKVAKNNANDVAISMKEVLYNRPSIEDFNSITMKYSSEKIYYKWLDVLKN
jgi:glycosyltransferase involved in cell wall biosynthesis